MAATIDATPGSADANSYATVAQGDTYHEGRSHASTWEDADEEDKIRALITATRLLDQQFDWNGTVVDGVQALLWPRIGVYGLNGYLLDAVSIPKPLREATAEYARLLIEEDRTLDSETALAGIKRVKAGPVDVEFKDSLPLSQPLPDAIVSMIPSTYYRTVVGRGAVTLYRA
jgi:hypothetical protein